MNQQAQEKVGSLVSLSKTINYLSKKKKDYENKMLNIKKSLNTMQNELDLLTKEFEDYEFTTYEELIEEMQSIKRSNEYK